MAVAGVVAPDRRELRACGLAALAEAGVLALPTWLLLTETRGLERLRPCLHRAVRRGLRGRRGAGVRLPRLAMGRDRGSRARRDRRLLARAWGREPSRLRRRRLPPGRVPTHDPRASRLATADPRRARVVRARARPRGHRRVGRDARVAWRAPGHRAAVLRRGAREPRVHRVDLGWGRPARRPGARRVDPSCGARDRGAHRGDAPRRRAERPRWRARPHRRVADPDGQRGGFVPRLGTLAGGPAGVLARRPDRDRSRGCARVLREPARGRGPPGRRAGCEAGRARRMATAARPVHLRGDRIRDLPRDPSLPSAGGRPRAGPRHPERDRRDRRSPKPSCPARPRFRREPPADAVRRMYAASLTALDALDLAKDPWQTPAEFAPEGERGVPRVRRPSSPSSPARTRTSATGASGWTARRSVGSRSVNGGSPAALTPR